MCGFHIWSESKLTCQYPAGVERAKFDAPQPDRFPGDNDASLSEQIFNITVAQVETIVEPNCIGNDIGRESMALVGIHGAIVAISGS